MKKIIQISLILMLLVLVRPANADSGFLIECGFGQELQRCDIDEFVMEINLFEDNTVEIKIEGKITPVFSSDTIDNVVLGFPENVENVEVLSARVKGYEIVFDDTKKDVVPYIPLSWEPKKGTNELKFKLPIWIIGDTKEAIEIKLRISDYIDEGRIKIFHLGLDSSVDSKYPNIKITFPRRWSLNTENLPENWKYEDIDLNNPTIKVIKYTSENFYSGVKIIELEDNSYEKPKSFFEIVGILSSIGGGLYIIYRFLLFLKNKVIIDKGHKTSKK